MADITPIAGNGGTGGAPTPLNSFNPVVTDQSWPPGTPVCASAGGVQGARANAAGTAKFLGLMAGAGALGSRVLTKFDGPLELKAAEWDLVAGTTGGLTTGATYYVSAATAGKLTATPPSGPNYVAPVGIAISSTIMIISGPVPIPLVGGG